jgi:glutamyl-Q tRNA(Asp) synthetase
MYRGRFAPSPTGPLHLGSLFTAAVSYLDCLQQGGQWLLRIDDIDPPRAMPGASDLIIKSLAALGFEWHGPVHYQSQRHDAYRAAVQQLEAANLAYPCGCSRADIRAHPDSNEGQRYPGTCRLGTATQLPWATRVRTTDLPVTFVDRLQGDQRHALAENPGDYVIWRKDRLPAYHLANVVDDAWLRITHVVRGADLLDSCATHIHLQQHLGLAPVSYAHLPVLTGTDGHKLSKQTGAAGIPPGAERASALWVLEALGLGTALHRDFGALDNSAGPPLQSLWAWAATHWNPGSLNGLIAIPISTFGAPPQMD